MKNSKAQAIIIISWVLVILTILVVVIGHRVSLALSLSGYHRDRLKAVYLAKAGINRAIAEIISDAAQDYDALTDSWADNEKVFAKIAFDGSQSEFATVGYTQEEFIFGTVDEERKININIAAKELLTAFFEYYQIENAAGKVSNLLIWRGDIPDTDAIYEGLGYPSKAAGFTNITEIKLVKDITSEDFEKVNRLITVYGDGLININTVSPEILDIFCRGIARGLSIDESFAGGLSDKIIELRNAGGYFINKGSINIALTGQEEINIFNALMNKIIFKSENFLIESTGNTGKIKVKVVSVYNRKNKNTLYWHER